MGQAGVGKDTFARYMAERLEQNGEYVLITHYADLLKFICTNFFGWDGKKDEPGRSLLQYVGTNKIRKRNPDFQAGVLAYLLKIFENEFDWVLIPDCRFPNEYEIMYKASRDNWLIKIERPGLESRLTVEQQKHISENAMSDVMPDLVVNNAGSEYYLKCVAYDVADNWNNWMGV